MKARAGMTSIKQRLQGKIPKGTKRSSKWRTVRKHFLRSNPRCVVCESRNKLEVHHIIPFHVDPSLELNSNNLMVLCENKKYGINCHLLVGHRGNYRKFNSYCKVDADIWNRKIKE